MNRVLQREILAEFDLHLAHGIPTITNYQNELLRIYDVLKGEKNGRHFIKWILSLRLT